MEAVDGSPASRVFATFHGSAVESITERVRAESPSAEEIIFGASAVDGGAGFAVDEKHVVAFAPPIILILEDGHGDANEVSLAAGFEPDVIVFTGKIGAVVDFGIAVGGPVVGPAVCGCGLAILRVEVERVGGKRL